MNKNSQNGMKPLANPKDTDLILSKIESILKACATSGVSELKFGPLHVKFGGTPEHVAEAPSVDLRPTIPAPEIAEAPNHEVMNREALAEDEMLAREERLALLQIEDPLEFEKQLISGEIEPDESIAESDSEEA